MPVLSPETVDEANAFFGQLELVSAIVRQRYAGTPEPAAYGRAAYSASPLPSLPRSDKGKPAGVIVHYTASSSLASAVAWFCNPSLNSGRVAHLVVAQGYESVLSASELAKYPLVARLPALPVICRPIMRAGVHATWANGSFVGMELVNLGCDTSSRAAKGRDLAQASGRTWERYSPAQVDTAAYLVACLRLIAGFPTSMILGHEHVQSALTPQVFEDKRDPGPLFPWGQFRQACALASDPTQPPLSKNHPPWMWLMSMLGYGPEVPTDMHVKIFQYMSGLVVDGQVGPKTIASLQNRVRDRGLSAVA